MEALKATIVMAILMFIGVIFDSYALFFISVFIGAFIARREGVIKKSLIVVFSHATAIAFLLLYSFFIESSRIMGLFPLILYSPITFLLFLLLSIIYKFIEKKIKKRGK